jgi:hypothetical protein
MENKMPEGLFTDIEDVDLELLEMNTQELVEPESHCIAEYDA